MRTLISPTPEAIQDTLEEAVWPATATAPAASAAIAIAPAHTRAARAHTTVSRVLLGGIALQIFFAGLGVFGVASFLPHMILGTLVVLGSLALPLIAWRGHLGAALLHRSWLVFGLMILQGLLIDVGRLVHVVAALHPVNAMLLVLLVASMARINGVNAITGSAGSTERAGDR